MHVSTRFDIDIPEFTQADVIRITKVSAKTLQNWTDPNRGILRLSQASLGKGRRRMYSPLDMMAVTLIAHLSALGIAPNIVSSLFYENGISDWIRAAVADEEQFHVCRISFDADGLYARLITTDEENRRFARRSEELTEQRFAFVQLSLSDIAAFVLLGIKEISVEETPENERSHADRTFQAVRAHLKAQKTST
jgi:DNA-binding transcriptional MerR regulator